MEYLIELNLEFEVFFSRSLLFFLIFCYHFLLKICTYAPGDEIEFLGFQELREPRAKSISGEEGYEW